MANADAVRGEGGTGEGRGEAVGMGRSGGGAVVGKSRGGQRWGGTALG